MRRPTRVIARLTLPWVGLAAIFAFLLGASLFSEPSDCFRYGQQNYRKQESSSASYPDPNASSGRDNVKADGKEASAQHKCHPYWGPEWSLVWITLGLFIATSLLAVYTAFLFRSTRDIANDSRKSAGLALKAAHEHTETLAKVERAYVVAGGGTDIRNFVRCFGIDVGNYGRTPAFLRAYDVQFATRDMVKSYPCTVSPNYVWDDHLAPGQWKGGIDYIPIPPGAEVAYGAFWYEDWAKQMRFTRFILNITPHTTRPDVAGVDDMYRHQG